MEPSFAKYEIISLFASQSSLGPQRSERMCPFSLLFPRPKGDSTDRRQTTAAKDYEVIGPFARRREGKGGQQDTILLTS